MRLLSTEAEGVSDAIPEDQRTQFVNDAGRVGALLGLRSNVQPSTVNQHASTSAHANPAHMLCLACKIRTMVQLSYRVEALHASLAWAALHGLRLAIHKLLNYILLVRVPPETPKGGAEVVYFKSFWRFSSIYLTSPLPGGTSNCS